MRPGKGIILKMFRLQTEKFYTRMGREKLRYFIVNIIQWLTDMCYITEEKRGFVIVVELFALGVIFIWGNFTFCFFQSNNRWVYVFNRNIFIFKFYILLFFYIKIFFSLTTTYAYLFYRFTQQFIFFQYLVTLLMSIKDE